MEISIFQPRKRKRGKIFFADQMKIFFSIATELILLTRVFFVAQIRFWKQREMVWSLSLSLSLSYTHTHTHLSLSHWQSDPWKISYSFPVSQSSLRYCSSFGQVVIGGWNTLSEFQFRLRNSWDSRAKTCSYDIDSIYWKLKYFSLVVATHQAYSESCLHAGVCSPGKYCRGAIGTDALKLSVFNEAKEP